LNSICARKDSSCWFLGASIIVDQKDMGCYEFE
jgi:hypothetical protein